MTALTGEFCDQVKVAVVRRTVRSCSFAGCCHEQVGELPAALAALREQALHVKRATHVRRGGLHGSEGIK
jgi:hypothetical protein